MSTATTAKGLRPTFVYDPVFGTRMYGEELLALTRLEPWKTLVEIALDWAVILATLAAAVWLDRWFGYVAAVFVIGARQHALLILMHDASHQRILPDRRWNERVSDWLCAFPHFVSTDAYRKDHLRHHFYMNTDNDPNHTSKIGLPDWVYPKTKPQIAWIFTKELLGVGLLRIVNYILHYGENSKKSAEKPKTSRTATIGRLLYYAVVAVSLVALGEVAGRGVAIRVFALWIGSMATVLPALLRLRILSEHYGLERVNDLDHSRNYPCNPLERFFLAPHDVWLHIDHHLFPSIPFYNLRKAHAILEQIPEYAALEHASDGVFGPQGVIHDISKAAVA
jgi:fatty acid desaturase